MDLEYLRQLRELPQILQLVDRWVTRKYGNSPDSTMTAEQLVGSFSKRIGRTSMLLLVITQLVRNLKAEALTIDRADALKIDRARNLMTHDVLILKNPEGYLGLKIRDIILEEVKEMNYNISYFHDCIGIFISD